MTPAVREFLVLLDELVDAHEWPKLNREVVTVGSGDAEVLVRLPHAADDARDIELEIDDRTVTVIYEPERIEFTSRSEALHFIEMLGDGRVELKVHHGLLWTTMNSYRDGLNRPFRRTRMPWPSLRPRTEHLPFGFN
jgi:hypothetical protein